MTSKIETTNELRDDKVLRLVITSLYNTVDRAFIGSMKDVGALAISGLGVTMPFMTILGAFCVGLAVGGSTNIAIKLGEGNKEEAEKALGNTFAIELFVGIAMMIISAFFLEDILYFFGASSDTIKYSMDYMSVIMCGAWFNLPGFAMNSAIRGEGNPKLASKMMITRVRGRLKNRQPLRSIISRGTLKTRHPRKTLESAGKTQFKTSP